MCGIVGYIGARSAAPLILNGLTRLEYRGYDSAGIAVLDNGLIGLRRQTGKLSQLLQLVQQQVPLVGHIGIGHTRWATHGAPTVANAHPHVGPNKKIAVVHNGIVENCHELKAVLLANGARFKSETDTEIIAHLIEQQLATGLSLLAAARATFQKLQGANVVVVMAVDEPDKLIAVRLGHAGGVVIGLGENGNFIASDGPALLAYTRRVIYLEPQQLVVVGSAHVQVETLEGLALSPQLQQLIGDPDAVAKGTHQSFMQKEIHEQSVTLAQTLAGRVDYANGRVRLDELRLTHEFACKLDKIVITACGSAAYAGMVGKYLIEKIARVPTEVVIASEFRYSDPVVNERTVVLAISQSGETADTLAALAEGRRKGATVWSIVNVLGSEAMRIADGYISMQCGPEIGVASTKAFTAPLLDLYLLAVLLAELRSVLNSEQRCTLVADLQQLPALVHSTLAREAEVAALAASLHDMQNCLFLGRGLNMPIALEGALKLKELAYVHAEGYAAGEMKHGPIALVDEHLPLVCLAPQDPWYDKMLSQIQQAKARKGRVIAVATDGDSRIAVLADHVLWIPPVPWLLSPVLTVLPLQQLAYHCAKLRGLDVDQPRNLAKSVTVE